MDFSTKTRTRPNVWRYEDTVKRAEREEVVSRIVLCFPSAKTVKGRKDVIFLTSRDLSIVLRALARSEREWFDKEADANRKAGRAEKREQRAQEVQEGLFRAGSVPAEAQSGGT